MKKIKITTIIVALIIIAGIIVSLTAGFNVDMETREHKQIIVSLEKEFDLIDVKEIAKEVLKDQEVEIQKSDRFEESIVLKAEEITEEQKNEFVSKINEKYETKIENEDVIIHTIPRTKLFDLITSYVWTFIVAIILIEIYNAIRYKKLGILKAVLQPILVIILTQMLVLSIMAIARIPVGNNMLSIIFVAFTLSVFASTTILENKLQKLKIEETKK